MDINSITEIKADGIRYMVCTEPSPTLGLEADGQINYDQQQITIKNTKPAVWLQILWHELLHHISCYRVGNSLTEDTIDAIATGINAILLDNPDLTMEIWQVAETGNFTIEDADADETD